MNRPVEPSRLCVGTLWIFALTLCSVAFAGQSPWECADSVEVAGTSVRAHLEANESPGLAVIEERGVELRFRLDQGRLVQPIALFGPRLGWLVLRGDKLPEVQIEAVTSAPMRMRLHQGCEFSAQRLRWIERASALALEVDPSTAFSGELAAFESLLADAPDAFERAAARQLLAAAQYRVGQYTDAAGGYAEAAEILLRLGDRERAGAALLGWSDMLRLLSDLEGSERIAHRALEHLTTPATAYFALRARENLCLVLHYRQQWETADRCVSVLPEGFRALGDLDGYVNAQTNWLVLRRDMGQRLDVAEERARYAAIGTNPDVGPMRRGRWLLALAMALRDQGDAAAALRMFNEALAQFQAAPEESERWIASTLLQVAGVYSDLGTYSQAYESHRQAVRAMALMTAPGRVASALTRFAEIDRRAGYHTRAAMWARQSAEIYQALSMPGELAGALLTELELNLDSVPQLVPDQASLVQLDRDLPAHLRPRLALLQARINWIATGEFAVEWPDERSIPLAVQLEATALAADAHFDAGQVDMAVGGIVDALYQVESLARRSANPVLGHMLLQSLKPLRGLAASRLAIQADGSEELAAALLSTHSFAAFKPSPDNLAFDGLHFSASVARRLIYGIDAPGAGDERLLLDRLAAASTGHRPQSRVDIGAIQGALAPGDGLLIVVPGRPTSTVALISHSRVLWREGPGEEALGRVSRDVLEALERRQRTWSDTQAALDQASLALLGPFAGEPLPSRLLVLYDESVAMIPWAALRWPGQQEVLAQSTQVSWITQFRRGDSEVSNASGLLRLFVANPRSRIGELELEGLPNADYEQTLIEKGQPGLAIRALRNERATPESLVAAFDEPGSLVHIAAHGHQAAGLLGYSGLWLAPRAGSDEPQFVSWMDLAGRPIKSRLVVLNACQLAKGPSRSGHGSMSFATALSAAGAEQVVAALWPVSDSAAAVWVPAFYGAADAGNPNRSAEAVRQAQLALLRSRQFRHPFYWASLTHFRHLQLPP